MTHVPLGTAATLLSLLLPRLPKELGPFSSHRTSGSRSILRFPLLPSAGKVAGDRENQGADSAEKVDGGADRGPGEGVEGNGVWHVSLLPPPLVVGASEGEGRSGVTTRGSLICNQREEPTT